ncbi:MAG: fibronectin type III domain-containing protein [Chloroflexota bacterium]
MSGVLSSLLDLVTARVSTDYARAYYRAPLTAVPAPFNSSLALVAKRIGLDYARANQHMPLAFPVDIVNDTSTPQLLGDITVTPSGGTATRLTWTTNEVANSRIQFGTQPGSYTHEVFNSLYVTQHSVTLTGLQEGVTYYYKMSSTDPSGNTFTSQEFTFTFVAEMQVYLPVVIR